MWLLVQVARGNKYFDPETRIDNQVLICDGSDLVISGRSYGSQSYRFEARKGNENFTVADFPNVAPGVSLVDKFTDLAQRLEAVGAPPRR
jgi:hypothetical protein